ncbi:MAG: hypothetical protein FWF84_05980, partial [Kiritimatiellaeota bacterium]|nr:hypothetical protein [Kiritimatiellota bacterium]
MAADDDIIAAQATPPGAGGIAIVRVSGAGCAEKIAPLFAAAPRWEAGRFTVTRLVSPSAFQPSSLPASPPEGLGQAVALYFQAPHRYTGEEGWVRRFYPQACSIAWAMADFLAPSGLLGSMPYNWFIDWAHVDGAHYRPRGLEGENAFANALFYGACGAIGDMARLNGDTAMAERLGGIRRGIQSAFRERLYCPRRRLFADARFGDRLSGQVSEHGNMAPILFGLCAGQEAQGVIDRLLVSGEENFTRAEPFATAFTLRALAAAGRMPLALRIIGDRWGRWMADRGYASTPEEWGVNGSWRYGRRPDWPQHTKDHGHFSGFMRTLSHAWCAGPAEFLVKESLGLEILSPGCGRVRVRPRDLGMDWKARYPLPQGPLEGGWTGGQPWAKAPEGVEMQAVL